jgi:hypothetical protein
MRTLVAKLALCGLALAAAAQARGQVTVQYVDFPKGYEGRTYTRAVKGEDACDYLVRNVEDDQKLDVTISSNNESVFFDVFDPKGTNPRFTGWKDGEHFAGRFPGGGTVKVRVYQRYDIAARNETANYTMTIVPGDVPAR